jgi:hypothetical protein
MNDVVLSVTTNGSGAGSATTPSPASPSGVVYAIDYLPGTIATGATITVTDETQGASFTLLSKANAGTTNTRYYPRVLQHLNTDGSALTTHTLMAVAGKLKFTVASGGDTLTGKVIIHFMEL